LEYEEIPFFIFLMTKQAISKEQAECGLLKEQIHTAAAKT
jgi:hypothetical protein